VTGVGDKASSPSILFQDGLRAKIILKAKAKNSSLKQGFHRFHGNTAGAGKGTIWG